MILKIDKEYRSYESLKFRNISWNILWNINMDMDINKWVDDVTVTYFEDEFLKLCILNYAFFHNIIWVNKMVIMNLLTLMGFMVMYYFLKAEMWGLSIVCTKLIENCEVMTSWTHLFAYLYRCAPIFFCETS